MFTIGMQVEVIGTNELGTIVEVETVPRYNDNTCYVRIAFTDTETYWYRETQLQVCGMFSFLGPIIMDMVESVVASQVATREYLETVYMAFGVGCTNAAAPVVRYHGEVANSLGIFLTHIGAAQYGWCEGTDHPRDQECDCKRCDEHCICISCESCGARGMVGRSLCIACQQCRRSHCSCHTCATCGIASQHPACSVCEGCGDCCSCRISVNPCFHQQEQPIFHTGEVHPRMPSQRYVATEIEVSNMGSRMIALKAARTKWNFGIVRDSSLPSGGFEINTAPSGGAKVIEQITHICSILDQGRAAVTAECGLHVHVDGRDLDYEAMKRLVILYGKVENAVMLTQPKSRRSNSMCKPCGSLYKESLTESKVRGETLSFEELLESKVYDTSDKATIDAAKKHKYSEARYRSMNLHSWFFRGTIEFRMHTGTTNADKIIPWMATLVGIIDFAKDMSMAKIEALKSSSDAQRIASLLTIVPTTEARRYILSRICLWNGPSKPTEAYHMLTKKMQKAVGLSWNPDAEPLPAAAA